jgi:SSS family solute:Na+ symporter
MYTGILALALNLIVAIVVSLALRGRRKEGFEDRTRAEDYELEAGDPGVKDIDPAPEGAPVPAGRP